MLYYHIYLDVTRPVGMINVLFDLPSLLECRCTHLKSSRSQGLSFNLHSVDFNRFIF